MADAAARRATRAVIVATKPLQVTAAILSILAGLVRLAFYFFKVFATTNRYRLFDVLAFDSAALLGGLAAVAGGAMLFTKSQHAPSLACFGAGSCILVGGNLETFGPSSVELPAAAASLFRILPLLCGIAVLVTLGIHAFRTSSKRLRGARATTIWSGSALIILTIAAGVPILAGWKIIYIVLNVVLLIAAICGGALLLTGVRTGQVFAAAAAGFILTLNSGESEGSLTFLVGQNWSYTTQFDWMTAGLVLATALVGGAIVFLCGPKVTNHAPPLSQPRGRYAQQQPLPQYPYPPQR